MHMDGNSKRSGTEGELGVSAAEQYVSSVRQKTSRELRAERIILIGLLGFPFLGVLVGTRLLWTNGISALDAALLVSLYVFTGLGISVGFHRLFTHRSFNCPRWIRGVIAIAGSLAVEGPMIRWVADHRRHHQYSDRAGDPHSPRLGVAGAMDLVHAHVGWFFAHDMARASYFAKDLLDDPMIRRIDRLYLVWMFLTLAVPTLIGFACTGTARGAFSALIWGGLVRIFCVHHSTWLVNSVCHTVGSRPYRSNDGSTNNFLVALLTFGEGWHNNHHAFPGSARHGFRTWQIDVSWWVIRSLELMGAASDVRVPDTRQLARRKIQTKEAQ
ncbi:acyl-CoA desaturase [Paraburkholderia sp. HD33-4]|uniref:acyl-CoA desaturase n=1 Tax=Paraburkholderia sp. HD33-4 TaxID=2883242 RepID=UPI002DD42DEB|nr:fatty acid desaturase [Paraburkholderia sp. HD33-4]